MKAALALLILAAAPKPPALPAAGGGADASLRSAAPSPGGRAPVAEAPPPAPTSWAALGEAQREARLSALAPLPLRERLLAISEGFLGVAYQHSPLGEEEGVDPDPTLRFDAVDCLTFVEEVMALSLSGQWATLPAVLQALRYRKEARYEDRNHLMEAQWLPNNAAKGHLRDVTRQYGGADAVVLKKRVTSATWQSGSSQALKLPRAHQLTGEYPLTVIPLARALAHSRAVPSGTLLLIVREDRPSKVTRITHLGFVVQKRQRTYLRHAARNAYGRVVDEDLESFLLRNSRYTKWKVEGISLWEVLSPRDSPVVSAGP